VRRALKDLDRQIIKTVPRRGYVFAARSGRRNGGEPSRSPLQAHRPACRSSCCHSRTCRTTRSRNISRTV
jgi:DNA-binding winged helix-turn-helix (wHTH) protein